MTIAEIKYPELAKVAREFAAFAAANGIDQKPLVTVDDTTPLPGGDITQYNMVYADPIGSLFMIDVNVLAASGYQYRDDVVRELGAFLGNGVPIGLKIDFGTFLGLGPTVREIDGKRIYSIVNPALPTSPVGPMVAPGLYRLLDNRQEGEAYSDATGRYVVVSAGMFTKLWQKQQRAGN